MPAVITDVPGSYGFAAKSFVDSVGNLLALVLAWSYLEPHRAGEVAMVPPGNPGTPVSWGRERNGQSGSERLGFSRCRPGLLPQPTATSATALSRTCSSACRRSRATPF
jgi:hypothetical protein